MSKDSLLGVNLMSLYWEELKIDPIPLDEFKWLNHEPAMRGRVTIRPADRASDVVRDWVLSNGPRFYLNQSTERFVYVHSCKNRDGKYWCGSLPKDMIEIDEEEWT